MLTSPIPFEERIAGKVLTVAHGGGLNSSAMILLMLEKGIRPDHIAFADTGGERPETYENVKALSDYISARGFPEITTVRYRNKHRDESLEAECLRSKRLPSKSYGFGACSEKWKTRPQVAALRLLPICRAVWKERDAYLKKSREYRRLADKFPAGKACYLAGAIGLERVAAQHRVVKLIGFDAGEARRVKYPVDSRFSHEYPLVEWGIFREDCREICERHGFKFGKSSCFFCPSMRKPEILELRDKHPDLLARALAIEDAAKPSFQTVNGLGRRLNWRDFLAGKELNEMHCLIPESPEQDCGCYDG